MAFGLAPASPLIVGMSASMAAIYMGVGLFPWSIMAMVRGGFAEHSPAWTVWIQRGTLVWGAFLIGARFTTGSNAASVLTPMTFLPAIAASVYIGFRAARASNADIGSRVDGRRLLVALMLFFGFVLYDLLGLTGVRESTGFHVHWGLLLVVGAFVAIFARRLVEAADTLQAQTGTLAASEMEGRAVTRRLLADANELLAAVGQLRDSGAAQNETIEKQAAALQETHVTAEEIRRTSTLASEKAQTLLAQAAIADDTQRAGERAVVESLAGLESIGSEVAAMATAMNEVDNLAREIGGIVDVVKALADQSNMLALNAAIEAVRSGEHGKGFAVVAREVRRLADQSIQSTERIRGVLERLADGVRQSTSAGERGEQSVATALERLRGSGDQMRSMSEILRETNAAVRQISAAVTQQNAGISQIFTAVEHLSDQMKEAVRRVQEAESATVVVETVASRMSNNHSVA